MPGALPAPVCAGTPLGRAPGPPQRGAVGGRGVPGSGRGGVGENPPRAPQRALPAGFAMPRTVRESTYSPIAVISHSPENCLISFAIITPVRGSACVMSKRTSSSFVWASTRRQYALATSVNFWPEKELTVKTRPVTSGGGRPGGR